MKEELIRVLNIKLDDLNSDIDSLVEINKKIDSENESLSYVSSILDLFKDNDEKNILNFSKLSREDFEKALEIIGESARDIFNTDSCNYEGLVYLINGINNGISLELTDEQKNGINYLIDSLYKKVDEYTAAIDGYELVKTRYDVSDVAELEKRKESYNRTIESLSNEDYIEDTDLVMEALRYHDLSEEEIIDMLGYILEYNANVYREKGPSERVVETPIVEIHPPKEETKEEKESDVIEVDNQEENVENNVFSLEENDKHEETKEEVVKEAKDEMSDTAAFDNLFHFNEIPAMEFQEFNPTDIDKEESKVKKEEVKEEVVEEEEPNFEIPSDNEAPPMEEVTHDEIVPEEYDDVRIEEEPQEEIKEDLPVENGLPEIDEVSIDNDFKDVIDSKEDYEQAAEVEEAPEGEKTSTRELQKLFDKYGIKEDNTYLNELVTGDTRKYEETLELLSKKGLIDKLKGNGDLLVEILLNSNADDIVKALEIIENDLSVDKDDYEITTKIAIDTIPSIFVAEGGNYVNFVNNVVLFKELGINLINLFDFSKEVFVADHDRILKNLEVVQKYGYDINYKNAKYLLLLPNIGDKLDYYVESVYEDKIKGEVFDGASYIKDFAVKLNIVTDETIKRIRYSSENGKKVFGSKPKSLTGEITNLKVNALDISNDYLDKFFDNEFATLTGDEVREYTDLIHNSSNVGDYSDELEILNPYLDGLRYVIEGINISSNKVLRNYNILRSYGMDKKKSLEFAVCYNLVITKEEYDKLESKLEEIGGNL